MMEMKPNQTWISELATYYQHLLYSLKKTLNTALFTFLPPPPAVVHNSNVVLLIRHRIKMGKNFELSCVSLKPY